MPKTSLELDEFTECERWCKELQEQLKLAKSQIDHLQCLLAKCHATADYKASEREYWPDDLSKLVGALTGRLCIIRAVTEASYRKVTEMSPERNQ